MEFEEFVAGIGDIAARKDCPVGKALELFSGKWVSRVILELLKADTLRFGELKRGVAGITNTMLSSTLKNLEQAGIVKRTQYDEMPVRVEYALTEAGRATLPIFYEIAVWAGTHSAAPETS